MESSGTASTALERIVTLIVYVAIIALLLWFILFAGPPSCTADGPRLR